MAEVHYFGQILGGSGFQNKGLLCKWEVEATDSWDVLEGHDRGQTHTNWARDGGKAVWAHPVDVHFECLGLAGWPKLCLQVWTVDEHGKTDIAGYGFMNFPTAPGMYDLQCPTWVPEGTAMEKMAAFFAAGRPRLIDESVVHCGSDRFRLSTVCSGTVHVRLGCVTRDFRQNGISAG